MRACFHDTVSYSYLNTTQIPGTFVLPSCDIEYQLYAIVITYLTTKAQLYPLNSTSATMLSG